MRVGVRGRRTFASVGPVGIVLLLPLLFVVLAVELIVFAVRLCWFAGWVVVRLVVDGVLWVVAHVKSRREKECPSRRDEG